MSEAEHLPLPEPVYRGIDQAGHTYAAGAGGPALRRAPDPVRGMRDPHRDVTSAAALAQRRADVIAIAHPHSRGSVLWEIRRC